ADAAGTPAGNSSGAADLRPAATPHPRASRALPHPRVLRLRRHRLPPRRAWRPLLRHRQRQRPDQRRRSGGEHARPGRGLRRDRAPESDAADRHRRGRAGAPDLHPRPRRVPRRRDRPRRLDRRRRRDRRSPPRSRPPGPGLAVNEELPAYSLDLDTSPPPRLARAATQAIDRDWAWAGSTGKGVRVCVLDSGIEAGHPLVGEVQRAVVVNVDENGNAALVDDEGCDVSGHGTACASIIRSLAPDCELTSVRVLTDKLQGGGAQLIEGLRWAVRERHQVVNLSLSTAKRAFAAALHDLADEAYFHRTVIVASAHNMHVDSWPWRFSSVVSVASHTDP